MSGNTPQSAILLLILGNFAAILSDVVIKMGGTDIPVFQFVLLRTLMTLGCLLLFWPQIQWKRFGEGLGTHLLRAHVHLVGISCMVLSLAYLPLATANAIFYTAPLLVVAMSILFTRQRVSTLSLLAVISGFVGVLVILRPLAFGWASIAALAVAFSLALGAMLVSRLPVGQTTVHKLFMNYLLMLPLALVLAGLEQAEWQWQTLWYALASSLFILAYNITVLLAYRSVAANRVTSAEYTGLIWAILIGWSYFGERPDVYFALGAGLIVVPLILISMQAIWQQRRRRLPVSGQLEARESSC